MISGVGFNTSVQGIARGMEGLNRNASEIAQAGGKEGADIVQPLVESKLNQRLVEANVKMLKAQDETLGRLLDEMA